MKADAVFEGGGIRGIAFAGAIQAMEENNVEWVRLAGTSVGSIIASLLAAGYKSNEINEHIKLIDFHLLRGRTWLNRIPFVGNMAHLLLHLGMYQNDYIEKWLHNLLLKKGISTFADLPAGKLKIIASDITNGRMLIFPDDLPKYNINPATFSIAKAVMMSTSIPFFYRPVRLQTKKQKAYIIDGGLLSNFPIWLFDAKNPRFPTFGFHFLKDTISAKATIPTPFHLAYNVFRTMMQAHDLRYLKGETLERTITIDPGEITATDFELSATQMDKLYQSGYQAASDFLATWNFEQHKKRRKERG